MPEHEITERFLKALGRYFNGEINARDGAKEAGLSGPNKFLEILKEAYGRGYVTIRSPIDQRLCDRFRQWAGLSLSLEPYIVKGKPSHRTFSLKAAEVFLIYLKRLLINDKVSNINIGIVSGSTTALLVEALVTSSLWDEVMTEAEAVKHKDIKVIGLTANPVKGWDLQGDANISAYNLAVLLRDKLGYENHPDVDNRIVPWGMTNSFVVMQDPSEKKSDSVPPIDRVVLEITDPNRLKKDGSQSKLDIVLYGVGSPECSLFTNILASEEIKKPAKAVGDCAYVPIDKNGKELPLLKEGVTFNVYSAIRLSILRQLVEAGKMVMLVDRNSSLGVSGRLNKTPVIRAAIRGRYVNVVCTDEQTAEEIMKKPA